MGTVIHHTIVVTSWKREALKQLRKKACTVFEGLPIPKVTKEVTNGYCFLYIPADGSKEGWGTSNHYNDARASFIEILNQAINDGTISEWYEVRSGETSEFMISNSSLKFEPDENVSESQTPTEVVKDADAPGPSKAEDLTTWFDETNAFHIVFNRNNDSLEVLAWVDDLHDDDYLELKPIYKQSTLRYSHTIETLSELRDRDRLVHSMATYMVKTVSTAIREGSHGHLIQSSDISWNIAESICDTLYDHYLNRGRVLVRSK